MIDNVIGYNDLTIFLVCIMIGLLGVMYIFYRSLEYTRKIFLDSQKMNSRNPVYFNNRKPPRTSTIITQAIRITKIFASMYLAMIILGVLLIKMTFGL